MVRAVIGTVLLLVGLPLLLAGGALWFAMQHQDAGGGYSAPLATVTTDGYAVVASDVDSLLRREAPFARGGETTLRLTAHTGSGPAFVGLAPAADAARYLADVPYTRVDEVRLARGPLPVVTAPVDGAGEPAGPPQEQPFWVASSLAGALEWSPYETRDQRLALVVMDPAGSAPLAVDLTAQVQPQWLGSTTVGLLVLGTVLVLVAVVALAWPHRAREIVYVVPPAQMPEIAARLGVPVPREAGGAPEPPPPVPQPRSLSPALLVPEFCLGTTAPAPACAEPSPPGPVPEQPPDPEPPESPVPPPASAPPAMEWPPAVASHATAAPVAGQPVEGQPVENRAVESLGS